MNIRRELFAVTFLPANATSPANLRRERHVVNVCLENLGVRKFTKEITTITQANASVNKRSLRQRLKLIKKLFDLYTNFQISLILLQMKS